MKENELTTNDTAQIQARGQSVESVITQLQHFRNGHRFIHLNRRATLGDGIVPFESLDSKKLISIFDRAAEEGRVSGFIPASGAATRMFKGLTSVLRRPESQQLKALETEALLDNSNATDTADAKEFMEWWRGIKRHAFPFHATLKEKLQELHFEIDDLIQKQNYKPILECLLTAKGLNYSDLPKALIPFHLYSDGPRLALEEHLRENAQFIADKNGNCKLHFTVSPEHENLFHEQLDLIQKKIVAAPLKQKLTNFEIELSHQRPETDTLAVDENNQPIRSSLGELVFRPGGHGALIQNLEGTSADLLFIKNIDNVVTDSARERVIGFRKVMGGLLIQVQQQIFEYLKELNSPANKSLIPPSFLTQIEKFIFDSFGKTLGQSELNIASLNQILNRPIRVCAMVKNQGEPGGGPFWVEALDGATNLQIIEASQIDKSNLAQKNIFGSATHFNPVDLVCGLKNYQGENFNLDEFVDQKSFFISTKSLNGKTIKALELPGLWNGSMAFWNTLFIEAPVDIFNPVKTVNDLLRPSHQSIYNRV